MNSLSPAHLLGLASVFGIESTIFWPYFTGIVFTVVGLTMIVLEDMPRAEGLDKALTLGRLFIAVPMAVFGADHFMFWRLMGPMVPRWIPWHSFWLLLVGAALVLAAASIIAKRFAWLASTLLAAMLFSFVLLIHIPNVIKTHGGDRFLLAVALRDTSFSAGALAFAAGQAQHSLRHTPMLRLARMVIGIVSVVFGAEHFLHPHNVPIIPLELMLPAWIPGHLVLSYATGALMILCGLGIVWGSRARLAATWLGICTTVVLLLVYLPILLAKPDVDTGLNYFADTMVFCGCALVLADALPVNQRKIATNEFAAEPLPVKLRDNHES